MRSHGGNIQSKNTTPQDVKTLTGTQGMPSIKSNNTPQAYEINFVDFTLKSRGCSFLGQAK